MSTLTPITLRGTITAWQGADLYGETDGLGLQNQYQTFNISVNSISAQSHDDSSTRKPNTYNGLDMKVGMFITDTQGSTVVRIKSISAKTVSSYDAVVEDVDMMSFRLNGTNDMSTSVIATAFSLNTEGEPIFASAPFDVQSLQRLISRFSLNERDDRVKFKHDSATNLLKGDIVSIKPDGNLSKYGNVSASSVKVGVVVDVFRSSKDVFVKPFNDIIRNFGDPEDLTALPGSVYYTDLNNLGKVTATPGGNAVFMHLNKAIPTTANITSPTNPTTSDFITINDITVHDGPGGDTDPIDTAAWRDKLNTYTAQTNVSAAIGQAPGQIDAEANSMAYPGSFASSDMMIPINPLGTAPTAWSSITISDGNNIETIVFDTPDIVAIGHDIMSPTAIKAEFDAAILAGNLDIICTLYNSTAHNGQAIRLITTGASTGITLVNVTPDAFGGNVISTAQSAGSTGLSETGPLGITTLTLTRNSGGPIDIEGSPINGGYINQSGAVSSASGRVPFLLMMEAAIEPHGVSSSADLDKTPSPTSFDGAWSVVGITHTPFLDSNVTVNVNGMEVNLGDGVKTKDCYFSDDDGVTAKLIANIEAGDQLHWNGSIAGYQLEASDDIDIKYEKSNID